MTFQMDGGAGVFSCDTCPDVINTGMENFKDASIESRRRGWRAYVGPDKEWAHACPLCVQQHAEEKRR